MGRKKREESLVQKGIRVNEKIYRQFKSQADLDGIGVSDLIRKLMKEYLIDKEKK